MRITIPERQVSPTTSAGRVTSLGGERAVESQMPQKTATAQSAKIASNVVLNLGKRFQEAYDFKQNLKSKSAMTEGDARVREELKADPDFMNVSVEEYEAEYNRRFQDLSDDVGGNIDSPGSRKFFNGMSEDLRVRGGISARAIGRQRVLDETRSEVTRSLEVLSNAYMTDANPKHFEDMNGVINGAVSSGAMSNTEATTLMNATTQNAIIGNVEENIRTDASKALEDLKKDRDFYVKGDDPLMSVDKYNELKAKAKSVMEISNNAMKSETREKVRDSLTSVLTTGREVPGIKLEVEKVLGKDALKGYEIDVRNNRKKYGVGETVKNVDGDKLIDTLAGMKPAAGSSGYAGKYEAWVHALNAADQRSKALKKDPVQYVQTNSPELDTVSKRKAEQSRLGVPDHAISILSNRNAGLIVQDINNSNNPGEVTGLFSQLEKLHGDDYPLVIKDLVKNGMSDQMQLVGTLKDVSDLKTRDIMFSAIKTGRKELLNLQGENATVNKQAVTKYLDNELMELNNSIFSGGISDSRTAQANSIRETIDLTAHGYIANENMDPGAAAERAYTDVIGSKYNFVKSNENYFRLPQKYNKEVVTEYLGDFLKVMDMSIITVPGSSRKTMPKTQQMNYKKTILDDGYWSTNENETGVILFDAMGQPVTTTSGSRVELYFDATVKPPARTDASVMSKREIVPADFSMGRTPSSGRYGN